MANNYMQWSAAYTSSAEEIAALAEFLQAADDDVLFLDQDGTFRIGTQSMLDSDEGIPNGWEPVETHITDWKRYTDTQLWLYEEESGDIETLADLIAKVQTEHDSDAVFSLSWAETCSAMRVDEFSGGAVVVYKGEQRWINTSQWMFETAGNMAAAHHT